MAFRKKRLVRIAQPTPLYKRSRKVSSTTCRKDIPDSCLPDYDFSNYGKLNTEERFIADYLDHLKENVLPEGYDFVIKQRNHVRNKNSVEYGHILLEKDGKTYVVMRKVRKGNKFDEESAIHELLHLALGHHDPRGPYYEGSTSLEKEIEIELIMDELYQVNEKNRKYRRTMKEIYENYKTGNKVPL